MTHGSVGPVSPEPGPQVLTDRLLLRQWRAEDEAPMAAINRDPDVTRFLNRPVDEAAVATFHSGVLADWRDRGTGFYAVEVRESGEFIGFVGVTYPLFLPELAHRPEVGWRLSPAAQGRGYATEAALAV